TPKGPQAESTKVQGKAEAIAPVAFEVTDNADENFIATLIELHRERWRRAGQCGMIEANRSEGFLRAMAPLFAAQGLLRIFTIRFGRAGVRCAPRLFPSGDSFRVSQRVRSQLPPARIRARTFVPVHPIRACAGLP